MKKSYLLFYNALCCTGWAFCAVHAIMALATGASAKELYAMIGTVLMISQTAMLLEVLHAMVGLVPSPVVMVFIQVMSRIFIVWGQLYWVPACQQHWSLILMVISWSITEVIRYSFYGAALLGTVPYPLFYIRYSTFIVFYPTGITGEVLQALVGMFNYWDVANPLWFRLSLLILILYVPGSPGMIGNMWGNRKRSLKKRAGESVQVEPTGVQWPKDKKGERSSTALNQGILAAAAKCGPGGAPAAAKISSEKKWRFKYNEHLLEHVSQSLESEAGCIAMATGGLAHAHDSFQFIRNGKETPMKVAMDVFATTPWGTAEITGGKSLSANPTLEIMYGGPTTGQSYTAFKSKRASTISGAALRKQLDAWAAYGTIEPDVAEALKRLQDNETEWLDLSDMYFVLLGAGSAMGPLLFLLALGANVVAVAQSRTLWRILRQVESLPGRVIFPVLKGSEQLVSSMLKDGNQDAFCNVAGCNLIAETPEIANWIVSVAPGKALTIGNYTYLDGAQHVQIAVACDAIMERVCARRSDTALAFLGTPTDAHVVTEGSVAAVKEAQANAPMWMRVLENCGILRRNTILSSGGVHFSDAIVTQQGPNYILAKRLQHWRAVVARASGHTVSSNVAPSSATASVTSNAAFAAAYEGFHLFKPMEVAYQELAMTMCAALLVSDLKDPKSAARASTKLPHPLCLFQRTSFHGGVWRCAHSIDTIGVPAAAYHYLVMVWPHILIGVVIVAVLAQYTALGTVPGPVGALLSVVPMSPVTMVAQALTIMP